MSKLLSPRIDSRLPMAPRRYRRRPAVSLSKDEIERYRWMAEEYRRICAERPFVNHCVISLIIGSRAFAIPISDLQAPKRDPRLTPLRQKFMAFTRVVSIGGVPNTWTSIGRTFHRTHGAVINAARLYGDVIAHAIEESNDEDRHATTILHAPRLAEATVD